MQKCGRESARAGEHEAGSQKEGIDSGQGHKTKPVFRRDYETVI